MSKRVVLWSVAVTVSTVLAIRLVGQTASPERQLVLRAAEAIGGLDRVMAIKTLQIIGYGQMAYFNGGSNITGHPDAPQKWQNILDFTQTIDVTTAVARGAAAEDRLRVRATVGQLGPTRTNERSTATSPTTSARIWPPQRRQPPPPPARRGGCCCSSTRSCCCARRSMRPAGCRTSVRRESFSWST